MIPDNIIIDVHTHRPAPYPQGIVSQSALLPFSPVAEQYYSVGIHPWEVTSAISEAEYKALEEAVARPEVVAIGECGLDLLRGGPLYKQINIFTRHVELSERTGKPLIIHCVRAHDHLLSLRRELKPEQAWVIHGFRQRGSIARLFLDAGCYLSFGDKYNPEALRLCPNDRMLSETDDSRADISDIIASLAGSRQIPAEELTQIILANTSLLFPSTASL